MEKRIKTTGITVQAAAEILGLSPATLRNWDRKGKLKAKRDSRNNYRYYDIRELEKFAEKEGLKKEIRQKVKFIH